MFRFGHGRWSLKLEDGWRGEVDEGSACIARDDGHGALLVSALETGGAPAAHTQLEAMAESECPEGAAVGDCLLGDFRGVHAMYLDQVDGVRWHRWYLGYGSLILLVTYTVPVEVEGDEDEAVMTMLRTLEGRGEAWR